MLLKTLRSSTILGLCLSTAALPFAQAQDLGGIGTLTDQKEELVRLMADGVLPECIEQVAEETEAELDWSLMDAEFFTQADDGTCTLDEQAMTDAGIAGFAPDETVDETVDEAATVTPEADAEPQEESVEAEGSDTPQVEADGETETAPETPVADTDIPAPDETPAEAEVSQPAEAEVLQPTEAPAEAEVSQEEQEPVEIEAEAETDAETTTEAPEETAVETAVETDKADKPSETPVVSQDAEPDTETAAPEQSTAAAASTDISEEQAADASVEVKTETVTEESSRSSNEDVKVRKDDNDNDRRDRLLTILGTAAAAAVAGAILSDGDEIVEDTGDRVIVRRNGQLEVRKDENEILRRPGSNVTTQSYDDGSSRTIVERPNGVRVLTIRDQFGYTIYRSRILNNGEEIVLFDDRRQEVVIEDADMPTVDQSRADDAALDYSNASIADLIEALQAQEMAELSRRYSLRQVRENDRLREVIPSIDLDVVRFATGSAAISPADARALDTLGRAMAIIIDDNPNEVFLIEGHTDAVGSETYNLALSDRRAESVALALTEYYDVPPENLIVQGYGERDLKINTQLAERLNRRATVRRITPLLESAALN